MGPSKPPDYRTSLLIGGPTGVGATVSATTIVAPITGRTTPAAGDRDPATRVAETLQPGDTKECS